MNFNRLGLILQKKKHQEVLFASMILAFLVFSFFMIDTVRSYRTEIKNTQVVTQNLVQVLKHHISGMFDKIDTELTDISEHMTKIKNLSVANQKWATDFFQEKYYKNFSSKVHAIDFLIFDEKGKLVKSLEDAGLEGLVPADLLKESVAAGTESPSFSQPIYDAAEKRWLLFLKRDIKGAQKAFGGSVVAIMNLSHIQNYFDELHVGDEGLISLFDSGLYMVARKPTMEGIIGHRKSPSNFNMAQVKRTYEQVSPWDGVHRILSGQKVGNYDFGVVVGLSRSEVLQAWTHRTLFNSILILSAFIGYAVFLFRYLESQESLEEQQKQTINSSKMSALGEMASGIAHEINNPLAIIQAKVYQIRKLVEQPGVDRQKIYDHADKLEITVQRISKIIKGLKSFSRNSDADPKSCMGVASIIESTLEFCRARFNHHSVMLKVEGIPQSAYIECRESQMAQVVLNLLNNAFDAVSELQDRWVSLEVKETANNIEIKVTDSGKGIPDHIVEKMMYPFFTTKDVGKGTGLGLSISKGIIEEHGGEMRYDKQAKNTCFIITLPKAEAPVQYSSAA